MNYLLEILYLNHYSEISKMINQQEEAINNKIAELEGLHLKYNEILQSILQKATSVEHTKTHLKYYNESVKKSSSEVGQQISFFRASNIQVVPDSVVIITEAPWNTLGDYYAAEKLLKLMKKNQGENGKILKFHWIIVKVETNFIPSEHSADERVVLENWSEFYSERKVRDILASASIVLRFPTFHAMQKGHYDFMRKLCPNAIPLNTIEYDYTGATDDLFSAHEAKLRTGFGHLGIFLEKRESQTKEQILRKLAPLQAEMSTSGVDYFSLLGTKPLYFGYRNKENCQVSNEVTVPRFVDLAIQNSEVENQGEDMVIIIPFNEDESAEIEKLPYIKQIDKGTNFIRLVAACQDKNGKQSEKNIFIFNVFPLKHDMMLALMALSHPLKMCTGDQSLSEVISMGIPLYQCMKWKSAVIPSLIQIVFKQMPHAKELSAFLLCLTDHNIKWDTDKMVKFIQNKKLQEQFSELRDYLFKVKNLNNNFPAIIVLLARAQQLNFDLNKDKKVCLDNFISELKNSSPETIEAFFKVYKENDEIAQKSHFPHLNEKLMKALLDEDSFFQAYLESEMNVWSCP